MSNWNIDMLTAIYARARDSANLINTQTTKNADEKEDDWKDRIKTYWEHLELIKTYKQIDDGTTSVWVDKRKDESNNDIEETFTIIITYRTRSNNTYSGILL